MTRTDIEFIVLVIVIVMLILAAVILLRLVMGRGVESQIRRVDIKLARVNDRLSSTASEVAVLRTEMRGLGTGLARVEHMVNLIFESAIEKGKTT